MGTTNKSKKTKNKTDPSERSGQISDMSLVVRCSEQVSRRSRQLSVQVGIRPESCEYRKGEFILLLRRFFVRAVFPGGKVVLMRPEGGQSRTFGARSETRSARQGSELHGGVGRDPTAFQLLANLKTSRSKEQTVTHSESVELLEICTSSMSNERNIAEWFIRLIKPDRLAELTLYDRAKIHELLDYYHLQTRLEAESKDSWFEQLTTVSICLDKHSFFLLHKSSSSSVVSGFICSLPLQEFLRNKELVKVRDALLERAQLACEVM
jgi:hypothetical protein